MKSKSVLIAEHILKCPVCNQLYTDFRSILLSTKYTISCLLRTEMRSSNIMKVLIFKFVISIFGHTLMCNMPVTSQYWCTPCICQHRDPAVTSTLCIKSSLLRAASLHGLTFMWWGCCGVCFWHKPTEIAHSFFFILFLCLFLSLWPFQLLSFQNFSQQLSTFSLCSSSLTSSALLVLSAICIYLFMKVSFKSEP